MSPRFHRWIPGTALAFTGVAIARLLAPAFSQRPQACLAVLGQLLGLGGLLLLAFGIRPSSKT